MDDANASEARAQPALMQELSAVWREEFSGNS